MRHLLTAALCLLTLPATAGTRAVVQDHALPRVAGFAQAAQALDAAAAQDCRADTLRPAYQATFDAWMGLSHLGLGPLEEDGRALTIAFWPDSRGLVGRTVQRLRAEEDAAVDRPERFAEVSIAGRGLFALERLLYEPDNDGNGEYTCRLAQAIAGDLSRLAQEIETAWRTDFADQLLNAGAEGNSRFLTAREASQALYTALVTGLEFTADQRLGRPMGRFDAPRPQVAEARRSGRPVRQWSSRFTAFPCVFSAFPCGSTALTEDRCNQAAAGGRSPSPRRSTVRSRKALRRNKGVRRHCLSFLLCFHCFSFFFFFFFFFFFI